MVSSVYAVVDRPLWRVTFAWRSIDRRRGLARRFLCEEMLYKKPYVYLKPGTLFNDCSS